jgi:hypothetical protein
MKNNEKEIEIKRKCNCCQVEKESNSFPKDKTNKSGFHGCCKVCKYDKDKKWAKNNPESHKKSHKKTYEKNRDKTILKVKQYNQNNKEKRKEYNIENRSRDKEYLLGYNKIHQNIIKPKRKQYNQNNKKEINIYQNNKYFLDPNHRVSSLVRSRIYAALNSQNQKKSMRVEEIIGTSIKFLKEYLEQQFKPEMNWENHGIIWEIDHIKPCSSFDLTHAEQLKICFHYTNHQPLFKTTEIAEQHGYQNEIGNRNKLNKI